MAEITVSAGGNTRTAQEKLNRVPVGAGEPAFLTGGAGHRLGKCWSLASCSAILGNLQGTDCPGRAWACLGSNTRDDCCRRRELGLGSLALVPLVEAREKALANRKLARQGGDPLLEKRRTQGIPTFAEAASRVLEQKRAGWRNRKHAREWLSSLRRLAFPRIGKVPVSEVTSADVLEILTPIWHRKAETARRVRLRAVLEWTVAMEYRIDNPCDRIRPVLGTQQNVVQHMQALPHRQVAAAIRTVRRSTALGAARLAFEFLVLTAARWGEVRWADGRSEAGDGSDPVKRASIGAAGWRKFHSRLPSSGRSRRKYPCGNAVKS